MYYVLSTDACKSVAIILWTPDVRTFIARVKRALEDHFGSEYEIVRLPRIYQIEVENPDCNFTITCDCFEPNDDEVIEEEIEFTRTNLYDI